MQKFHFICIKICNMIWIYLLNLYIIKYKQYSVSGVHYEKALDGGILAKV